MYNIQTSNGFVSGSVSVFGILSLFSTSFIIGSGFMCGTCITEIILDNIQKYYLKMSKMSFYIRKPINRGISNWSFFGTSIQTIR